MQQYFVDQTLCENDVITLQDDILYHLIKVLRKDSSYIFRLVDNQARVFYCHLIDKNSCKVDKYIDENNELDCDITCILALIKSDKFELCLQKLVELGVKRIVPYDSYRSVLKIKDNKKLERFKKIVREAAEQSHRNIIPEICDVINIKDIDKYKSEANYICYEAEDNISDISKNDSITFVIGPEGGFTSQEYEKFISSGFKSISLGKRILRAETAAIYTCSVIVSKCQ